MRGTARLESRTDHPADVPIEDPDTTYNIIFKRKSVSSHHAEIITGPPTKDPAVLPLPRLGASAHSFSAEQRPSYVHDQVSRQQSEKPFFCQRDRGLGHRHFEEWRHGGALEGTARHGLLVLSPSCISLVLTIKQRPIPARVGHVVWIQEKGEGCVSGFLQQIG